MTFSGWIDLCHCRHFWMVIAGEGTGRTDNINNVSILFKCPKKPHWGFGKTKWDSATVVIGLIAAAKENRWVLRWVFKI